MRRMLWQSVVGAYQRYHLSHLLMLLILALYSLVGAVCFCVLEGPHERRQLELRREVAERRSALARDRLLFDLQYFFVSEVNVSRLLSPELQTTLDHYDRLMDFGYYQQSMGNGSQGEANLLPALKHLLHQNRRWTIWGGLYFAFTVYTTVGYGDLVTETWAGKAFTVLYALVGIPLVITALNIWGGGLFILMQLLWQNCLLGPIRRLTHPVTKRDWQFGPSTDTAQKDSVIVNAERDAELPNYATDRDNHWHEMENQLPLKFALALLVLWVLICAAAFAYFLQWDFFDAAYFSFVSLTTIGFGETTMRHNVACAFFLMILAGLSVVSLSIDILQLQIEAIFTKMVRLIDEDYKASLLGERRISPPSDGTTHPSTTRRRYYTKGDSGVNSEQDAIAKYEKEMTIYERILVRLMSSHQRKLLNERMAGRANMTCAAVQTTSARQADAATEPYKPPPMNATNNSDESSEDEITSDKAGANRGLAFLTKAKRPTPYAKIGGRSKSADTATKRTRSADNRQRKDKARNLAGRRMYIYNIDD